MERDERFLVVSGRFTMHDGEEIFTVSALFTPTECRDLIARGEELGFEAATVKLRTGPQLAPRVRNNDRATFDDPDFADSVWARVAPYVPATAPDGRHACGLNPRWRFYRYDRGQRFKRHKDGVVDLPGGVCSRLSFLVYLNADYEGGETTFIDYVFQDDGEVHDDVVRIQPEVGMGLFFLHQRWHEGSEVTRGRKYLLRSDVMYASATGT